MIISIFSYFTYQYNNSINHYLEDLIKQYELQYSIIYNNFQIITKYFLWNYQ